MTFLEILICLQDFTAWLFLAKTQTINSTTCVARDTGYGVFPPICSWWTSRHNHVVKLLFRHVLEIGWVVCLK